MKKIVFLFLFAFCYTLSVRSQEKVVDVPFTSRHVLMSLLKTGESGFLLITGDSPMIGKAKDWTAYFFNPQLEEVWKTPFSPGSKHPETRYTLLQSPNLLWHYGVIIAGKNQEYVQFDLAGSTKFLEVERPKGYHEVTNFLCDDNFLYITYFDDDRLMVQRFAHGNFAEERWEMGLPAVQSKKKEELTDWLYVGHNNAEIVYCRTGWQKKENRGRIIFFHASTQGKPGRHFEIPFAPPEGLFLTPSSFTQNLPGQQFWIKWPTMEGSMNIYADVKNQRHYIYGILSSKEFTRRSYYNPSFSHLYLYCYDTEGNSIWKTVEPLPDRLLADDKFVGMARPAPAAKMFKTTEDGHFLFQFFYLTDDGILNAGMFKLHCCEFSKEGAFLEHCDEIVERRSKFHLGRVPSVSFLVSSYSGRAFHEYPNCQETKGKAYLESLPSDKDVDIQQAFLYFKDSEIIVEQNHEASTLRLLRFNYAPEK
ncbi:MAG: hypothetical protein J5I94_14200 [Phaeodactylibacter sp.]|nr:hypothetical protein [Phaeodactylibacter sp.]